MQAGDAGAMMFAHSFLTKIMWRSSKVRVAEELHIPPQEESVSWLTLSPIEEHFYQRQHETCLKDAHEVIRNLKNDVVKRKAPGTYGLFHSFNCNSLKKTILHILMPLHRFQNI